RRKILVEPSLRQGLAVLVLHIHSHIDRVRSFDNRIEERAVKPRLADNRIGIREADLTTGKIDNRFGIAAGKRAKLASTKIDDEAHGVFRPWLARNSAYAGIGGNHPAKMGRMRFFGRPVQAVEEIERPLR